MSCESEVRGSLSPPTTHSRSRLLVPARCQIVRFAEDPESICSYSPCNLREPG